jgi:hypothetical protein
MDRKRHMAMLQRRVELLLPLMQSHELNRNAFGHLLQEMLFECADVYSALHDLKLLHPSKPYLQSNVKSRACI